MICTFHLRDKLERKERCCFYVHLVSPPRQAGNKNRCISYGTGGGPGNGPTAGCDASSVLFKRSNATTPPTTAAPAI
jgi:hypothetical protein